MRIVRIQTALVALALLAITRAGAQSASWIGPKCDLKPGHFRVNSGVVSLKTAVEKPIQRDRMMSQAREQLTQAITGDAQDKNPAAWYYLGRYYLMADDYSGADTAFARAETLKPACKEDITRWRQTVWLPVLNGGIAAWQAGNTDSAMKSFRAAAAINQSDPRSYKYLASLLYQAGQQDSAVYYFRKTAEIAGKDSQFTQDRRDALYNAGRISQSLARAEQDSIAKIKADSVSPRWRETLDLYGQYLSSYPNDAEILASRGSVLMQLGKRDSAFAVYKQIIANADSVGAVPIFRAGVEIYQSAPPEPDTGAMGTSCRSQARSQRVTPARVKTRCDSVTTAAWRAYSASAKDAYQLSAQAFQAGVKINPYYRDGLFNLVNTYLVLSDTSGMLPMAQRLVSLDPMSRQSLRLLAFAHQQKGNTDSTLHYLRQADSTLVADVSVIQFEPDSAGASLKTVVQNLRRTPTPPMKLVFEFLTAKGEVVTSQTVDVPAIAAEQSQAFEIKGVGKNIAAWRYKKG